MSGKSRPMDYPLLSPLEAAKVCDWLAECCPPSLEAMGVVQDLPNKTSADRNCLPMLKRKRVSTPDGFGKCSNTPKIDVANRNVRRLKSDCPSVAEPALYHWVDHRDWPAEFADMSQAESNCSERRGRSNSSCSAGVRDGSLPPAHTPGYRRILEQHGIMFDDLQTRQHLTEQSVELCNNLLAPHEYGQAYFTLGQDEYLDLWQDVKDHNKSRIVRDLTPQIVPSAYLLYRRNDEESLQYIAEELSAPWTKYANMGGTTPKPDCCYGISADAFTETEMNKLRCHSTISTPCKVTDFLFFPFLVVDAKSCRQNIYQADMQNVHSASIATNAIVELHRRVSDDTASSLGGQILVFSISHDHERVKICGHFPLFRNGRTTFHRYYLDTYTLDCHHGRDRGKPANFVRNLYRVFYPQHLQRIRDILAQLPITSAAPIFADDDVASQNSEPSSQESGVAKRQSLRRSSSQGQITLMKQHMAHQSALYETQIQQIKESNQTLVDQLRNQLEQLQSLLKLQES